jgi:hypothetical protein
MPAVSIPLVALATAFDGLLAGASLDQSIKQLPARHRIGVRAFANAAPINAAPINFGQRGAGDDERALQNIFDSFERWQTARASLQLATFMLMLWSLATASEASDNTRSRTDSP